LLYLEIWPNLLFVDGDLLFIVLCHYTRSYAKPLNN
jgi:hypothetical protein